MNEIVHVVGRQFGIEDQQDVALPGFHTGEQGFAGLGRGGGCKQPGRQKPAERTMTANLGLALDDMAVAPLIYQKAVKKGIGTWLDL